MLVQLVGLHVGSEADGLLVGEHLELADPLVGRGEPSRGLVRVGGVPHVERGQPIRSDTKTTRPSESSWGRRFTNASRKTFALASKSVTRFCWAPVSTVGLASLHGRGGTGGFLDGSGRGRTAREERREGQERGTPHAFTVARMGRPGKQNRRGAASARGWRGQSLIAARARLRV